MSYDSDDGLPLIRLTIKAMDSRDLETIIMLLELAAISLTPTPDSQFTREELLREANAYGGDDISLHEIDVDIVLPMVKFLKKVPGKKYQLK